MPCDTRLKRNQTIQQRATEVREIVARLAAGLISGKVTARVGPQGAIAFAGLTDTERDGVTDACAYRRLMASTTVSALAKAAIARAEQLAGRSVDKQALAHGHHSHDGGASWHHGH
jgi:hypothetical protein